MTVFLTIGAALAQVPPASVALEVSPADQRAGGGSLHSWPGGHQEADPVATSSAPLGGTELVCELFDDGSLALHVERLDQLPDPLPPSVTCTFDEGATVVALSVVRGPERVGPDAWTFPIRADGCSSVHRVPDLAAGVVRSDGVRCRVADFGGHAYVHVCASGRWMRRPTPVTCALPRRDGTVVTVQVDRG